MIGVRDKDLKGRFLRQKGFSLQKAMESIKSFENEEKECSLEEVHEFKL